MVGYACGEDFDGIIAPCSINHLGVSTRIDMVAFNRERIYKASKELVSKVVHLVCLIDGYKDQRSDAGRAAREERLAYSRTPAGAFAIIRAFLDETMAEMERRGGAVSTSD